MAWVMLRLFRTSISLITLLFLFLATPSSATEQGLKLLEQQNYDAAFRASFASALRGDARSQYVIGRILISGLGSSETNTTDGLDFLEKRPAKVSLMRRSSWLMNMRQAEK